MDAILLVGGFGTRLLPLTRALPKPLIPLANVPFVERTVRWLHAAGADNIILSLHYNAEQFIDYFRQRALGVSLAFAVEETPLGTGGAIKNCEPFLRGERCIVCNGDIFTNLRLESMLSAHRQSGALASIALTEVEDPSRFGVIEMDPRQRILAFTEKPPRELARSREINAGVYLFERRAFDWFPTTPCSVERDVFPAMLREETHLLGYREWPYWTDLGTPGDYMRAHQDILCRKVPVPLTAREIAPGIWCGDKVVIPPSALVIPPVLLGDEVRLDAGATIGPGVVLGARTRVAERGLVRRSITWEGCVVHADSQVHDSILGREAETYGEVRGVVGEDGQVIRGG